MPKCGLCKWFREKREELLFEQEDWKLKQERYIAFFAQEQQMTPENRTMNGLEYKAKRDEIDRELNKKDKQIKFHNYRWSEHLNSPECKGGRAMPQERPDVPPTWHSIDETEFRFWQKQGKMTRTSGSGKDRKFEVMEE